MNTNYESTIGSTTSAAALHAVYPERKALQCELESELRGLIMAARLHGFRLLIAGDEMMYCAIDTRGDSDRSLAEGQKRPEVGPSVPLKKGESGCRPSSVRNSSLPSQAAQLRGLASTTSNQKEQSHEQTHELRRQQQAAAASPAATRASSAPGEQPEEGCDAQRTAGSSEATCGEDESFTT